MKIAEVGEKYGFSVDTLAQKGCVGGKYTMQRQSRNMGRELCKM
jgi:hypothetical protein